MSNVERTLRILQITRLPAPGTPAELLCREIPILDQLDDQDEWISTHGSSVECVITHALAGLPGTLMARLPNLRLVTNFGAGTDLIDVEAASDCEVIVTSSADVLTDDVADLALLQVISLFRGTAGADAFVRSGEWANAPYPLGRSAKDRRLGVLGLGRIGRAIASRAEAIGMDVGYHNRSPDVRSPYRSFGSATELARWCDVLVIALPGGSETRQRVDLSVIEAVGPDGFVVNIARGSILDEEALCDALESGRLRGAALDVFQSEPNVDRRILSEPRLNLTPHIGSATVDARQGMLMHVVENIRAFEEGRPLAGVVTKHQGPRSGSTGQRQ